MSEISMFKIYCVLCPIPDTVMQHYFGLFQCKIIVTKKLKRVKSMHKERVYYVGSIITARSNETI